MLLAERGDGGIITSMKRVSAMVSVFFLLTASLEGAEDRRQRVLSDRKEVETGGYWIYNDLAKGFVEAARTGKPMLVVLRCIP